MDDLNQDVEAVEVTEAPAKVVRKRTSKRPERKPVGFRGVDTTQQKAGFYRRWVNDKGRRIEQFEEGWYDKVLDDKGKPVTRLGGGNGNQYLMEIPLDLYEADQAKKHASSAESVGEMLQTGKGQYIPNKSRD